uniref:Si:dkey-25g12.4 n=1 Tax=Poecilia reticulata TaxID=8081 RepID=A0A3P9QBP6_POERE
MAVNPRITAVLPPAKTVTVYRNGDAFYPGKKVVLNPRHLSTFDNFMNTLTRHMEAPFGAVRRLYTPTGGHSVQELAQLQHGGSYVAAGNEPFKVLKMVTSYFYNGELRIPPARVRIPKHTLKSWDRVLTLVTHKVELRTGAVYKLCRLDGRPVNGSSELENNQHYVAAGPEKFKPLPYERGFLTGLSRLSVIGDTLLLLPFPRLLADDVSGEGKQRSPEGSGASSLLPACLLTVKQPWEWLPPIPQPVGPVVWDLRYPPAIRSPCPLVDSCPLLLERATDCFPLCPPRDPVCTKSGTGWGLLTHNVVCSHRTRSCRHVTQKRGRLHDLSFSTAVPPLVRLLSQICSAFFPFPALSLSDEP